MKWNRQLKFLLLDFAGKRIFWTSGYMIRSASFDGSDWKETQKPWSYMYSSYLVTSIAVCGEYLYSSTDWRDPNEAFGIKENDMYHDDKATVEYIIRDMQIYHGNSKSINICYVHLITWLIDFWCYTEIRLMLKIDQTNGGLVRFKVWKITVWYLINIFFP